MAKGHTTVKLKMDPAHAILLKRGLTDGGRLQQMLLDNIRSNSARYAPMDTGNMQNTSRIVRRKGQLIYPGPYARYLWYGKVMTGPAPKKVTKKKLKFDGSPKRGSFWTNRMWADNKEKILKNLADAAGGRAR